MAPQSGTPDDTKAFNSFLKKVSQDTGTEFSYRTVQILKEDIGWNEDEIARRTGVPRNQITEMLTSGRERYGGASTSRRP